MERITADTLTLLEQASITAGFYMVNAVHYIDKRFGDGYAAKHPELVGAFMRTASTDFATAMFLKTIQDFGEYLPSFEHQLIRLSKAIEGRIDRPSVPEQAK
jgi:hypothetical protein